MNNLSDEDKICACRICCLADAMKTCQTCPFNVGLIYRQLDIVKDMPSEYPEQLRQARLSNLKLSII